MVPTANAGGLIDFTSRTGEAEIVLVILVADQFFVEIADAPKNALLPATVNHSVHITFIAGLVRACPSHREGGMEDGANCPFHKCLGGGLHWPADIVSAGFAHDSQALPHIVRRIDSVSIHANNDVAASGSDGSIQ